ncbi:MAG: hypothetical protein H7240_10975 [Glaciimonas sp.]|nr:hypothetical protein [Glaciimonas sp.]
MTLRKDAATTAEILLYVEQRCAQDQQASLVDKVGQLQVPNDSTNVIPSAGVFLLDIRAADDTKRDAAFDDVLAFIETVCQRRCVENNVEKMVSALAVPCAPWLMAQLTATAERASVHARSH